MPMTPLGLAASVAAPVLAAMVVYAFTNAMKTMKRFNSLNIKFIENKKDTEAKLLSVCKDLTILKESMGKSDIRLQRVEDAILDIRAAVQRSDEQFTAIMVELRQLPRVMTIMESFQSAIAAIVPRTEVEARLKNTEERLRMVEQDLRGAK